MYQVSVTDNAVDKDIVQTQNNENYACENKLGT